MRGAHRLLPLAAATFLFTSGLAASGQTITGDITGTVTDPTGAVVTQANVTGPPDCYQRSSLLARLRAIAKEMQHNIAQISDVSETTIIGGLPRIAALVAFFLWKRKATMEVKVTHLDRVKFAIQSRSHSILCDQPAENGGEDCGMTPPELLLASLGSCAAFYAVQYLKTHNLAETGVEVTVTAEKLKQPARVGNFRVHVLCPVLLTEEQSESLMRSVHHCLIHNTLLTPPEIVIDLNAKETAGLQV